MKTGNNSGKKLEEVVLLIQKSLLQNDPKLKGGQFTIELNKLLTVNKTRHEVDVYVVTHPGTSYESVVLFECKDWKKPVTKNTVMNLKEKVNLIGATRGVLIARTLTKDARALFALPDYKRVHFRRCTFDINETLGCEVVHSIHDPVGISLELTFRDPKQNAPHIRSSSDCQFGGAQLTIQDFGDQWVQRLANQDKLAQRQKYYSDGNHWFETRDATEFQIEEFIVSGVEVALARIHVAFFVSVMRYTPKYRCSIPGDGEVVSFELMDAALKSDKIEVRVVRTEIQKSSDSVSLK